jgi:hypothetical protein
VHGASKADLEALVVCALKFNEVNIRRVKPIDASQLLSELYRSVWLGISERLCRESSL